MRVGIWIESLFAGPVPMPKIVGAIIMVVLTLVSSPVWKTARSVVRCL